MDSANNGFWFALLGASLVYLALPLAGVWLYAQLVRKMNQEQIADPPILELLVVFANYGALLVLILTSLLLPWSGLASLAIIYLIFASPIVMGIVAFRLRNRKALSFYHLYTFKACIIYFSVVAISLLMLYKLIVFLEEN